MVLLWRPVQGRYRISDSKALNDAEFFAESGMPKLHQMKAIVEKARNLRKRECLSGILSSNCQQSKTNKEKGAINSNNNGDNFKNP
ncbi:hypothetical protein TYRP_000417 [Tyrophagus putrescentiae]|nr:hypothetical protein TYRP_000417 [Tyrophagus putrescentiae]